MSRTIFSVLDIDRERVRWEESLLVLTPVERHGKVWFKREDYFAPLGYGGINGTKLRQCIWLVAEHVARTGGHGLISGASVKSPQLSMSTAVARHFGLPAVQVIGATNPRSALRHMNVAIAARLGARFRIIPVAYNPQLQKTVAELKHSVEFADYFWLEYGIAAGTQASEKDIEQFHLLGSEQVRNLPSEARVLYMPAGSCNSAVSVLYGIARFRPELEEVVLFGIGPTRLEWIEERLRVIERVTGLEIRALFRRKYAHHPKLAWLQNGRGPYLLRHYDLHSTGFASYQDEMPHSFEGIDFHPTYEGKVMRYVASERELAREFASGRVVFWIVGSQPSEAPMAEVLSRFGPPPEEVPLVPQKPKPPVLIPRGPRPGRACKDEVSRLEAGMDFRRPEYRREVFLRFYEFHLRYRSHPGAVYYVLPEIAAARNMRLEEKLWFAFLNGNTQNPVTSLRLFEAFPSPEKTERFQAWFDQHGRTLAFDTDRRYFRKRLPEALAAYRRALGGKSQQEFYEQFTSSGDPRAAFRAIWAFIEQGGFPYFGRLSAFSFIEYLRIMGLPVECDQLFLHDLAGSKSHRNGLCKVLGRDELDWHDSNPAFPGYTPSLIEWLTEEGELLLADARARLPNQPDVGYFTLESALCTYKSWHRPDRRYPNVYNDLFHDRIVAAEEKGFDCSLFWSARQKHLPSHLRLEDNPADCGCKPQKQNHYRLTGEVVMMDVEWPCFRNSFNDSIRARVAS